MNMTTLNSDSSIITPLKVIVLSLHMRKKYMGSPNLVPCILYSGIVFMIHKR